MDNEVLQKWLAEPRHALVSAVAEGVHAHVSALKSRGIEFYGYALLPGEPYDIHSLVAVTNGEGDIKVSHTDDQYRYYRFCVDEWMRWEHDGFAAANALLVQANKDFASMHTMDGASINMDEFEIAYFDCGPCLIGPKLFRTKLFRRMESSEGAADGASLCRPP